MKEFFKDLSTALREDGSTSPYSSKRIAATLLVLSAIIIGFMVVAFVTHIALEGKDVNQWLAITLLAVIALFLLFATVYFYFATKKDIDDTIKTAADIIRSNRPAGPSPCATA